jgi:enoyl-CoA hydratase/carnithine racemase
MTIRTSIEGPRADLVLDRPDVLNAMNWEVFDALSEGVDELASHDSLRVVVVRANGRSFSSGIDTSTFGDVQGAPAEMIGRAQAGFRKLAALAVPTIASVQGHALGAGLQLALACDIRVVASDASVGLLEPKYGLVPDLGGTQRLPALVGPGHAKKMIWLAERIDGKTAGSMGLAEVVCQPGDLESVTDELASRIAAAPPLVVSRVKRLVDLSGSVDLDAGMDAEAAAQLEMFASSDFGEAISAFLKKRKPNFSGT